ncbi:13195_t:CDS:2 [Racocetra persica]|uniref:13195_t:CDS:1 n=1 Tax=Racocetra persica TaxID=160502 RepID=A0ACA9N4B6_9GLOM|nr:13195_t:CDS:2 [Racocetra persica]
MKQETNSPSNMNSSSRSCIFIDASNPKSPNQIVNLNSQPFIKPAFPPLVNVRELMTKQSSGRVSVRGPNAFIIYRKVFFETARADGYQLPMTIVSAMASQSWEQEPEIVKELYRELAKEANKIRNEISPKSPRRKKREQWNIISFQPNNKSHKPSKSRNKSSISPVISEMPFNTTYTKSPDLVDNNFSNLDSKFEIKADDFPTNNYNTFVDSLQQLKDYEYTNIKYNDGDSTDTDQSTHTDSPLRLAWQESNDMLITATDSVIFFNNESILDSPLTSLDDGLGISDYSNFAANEYILMNPENSSYLLDLIPFMDIADNPGITFSSDGLSFS